MFSKRKHRPQRPPELYEPPPSPEEVARRIDAAAVLWGVDEASRADVHDVAFGLIDDDEMLRRTIARVMDE